MNMQTGRSWRRRMEKLIGSLPIEAASLRSVGPFGRHGQIILSAATEPAVKAKATKLKNRLLGMTKMVNRVEISPGIATNLAGDSLIQLHFWGNIIGSASERAVERSL